jgi:L-ribulose-5-phosphate 3-epimerase UlaE
MIELVRLPSVCDDGAGGYPLGVSDEQAVRKALQIAVELGLRIHYCDGGY